MKTPTSLKPAVNQSIQFEAATFLPTQLLWEKKETCHTLFNIYDYGITIWLG